MERFKYDFKIGDTVCYKCGLNNDKLSPPFIITGMFSTRHNINDCTCYLDFDGNESDVWEEHISNLVKYKEDGLQ